MPQAALGEKPAEEAAAVSIVVNGKASIIGTLRKAKCDQFSVRSAQAVAPASRTRTLRSRALPAPQLDLALGETFSVKHTGKSTVYLTGWRQLLTTMSDEARRRR
jgi:hypothetical protein